MSRQEFPAKVIEGYRITIPTRVRSRLQLGIGDEVDVVIMKAKTLEGDLYSACPECGSIDTIFTGTDDLQARFECKKCGNVFHPISLQEAENTERKEEEEP